MRGSPADRQGVNTMVDQLDLRVRGTRWRAGRKRGQIGRPACEGVAGTGKIATRKSNAQLTGQVPTREVTLRSLAICQEDHRRSEGKLSSVKHVNTMVDQLNARFRSETRGARGRTEVSCGQAQVAGVDGSGRPTETKLYGRQTGKFAHCRGDDGGGVGDCPRKHRRREGKILEIKNTINVMASAEWLGVGSYAVAREVHEANWWAGAGAGGRGTWRI